jgi:hypothetical protein
MGPRAGGGRFGGRAMGVAALIAEDASQVDHAFTDRAATGTAEPYQLLRALRLCWTSSAMRMLAPDAVLRA